MVVAPINLARPPLGNLLAVNVHSTSTAVVAQSQSIQDLVTAAHTDLVVRISTIQDMVTAEKNQAVVLGTCLQQLDGKLDSHVDSVQSYQHQLCQALHTDFHRMNSTLQGLKDLGSRHPRRGSLRALHGRLTRFVSCTTLITAQRIHEHKLNYRFV